MARSRQRNREDDGVRSVHSAACLPGIQIIHFEGSTRTVSYYNDVYAIAVLYSAEGDVAFRNREYSTRSGQIGLIQPDGIFCRRRPPAPERVTKILVAPSYMNDAARQLGVARGAVHFDKLLVWAPRLFAALSSLDVGLQNNTSTALEIETRFVTALELILGESRCPPTARADFDHARARRVRDVLHARFADSIALEELAKEAGVTTFHLPRLFKRAFGLPPHAYQNHLRLAQARHLLRQGMPPSTVAVEVGFTDQSHLNRHFRRTLGLTPAAFRSGRRAAR